jgi:hypothetical protein
MPKNDRTDQGKVAGSTPPPAPGVQGEGDYEAARRHRKSATEFAGREDVERAAREAAPDSAEEGRELLEAERRGRERARGEDRHDVMQEAAIDSPQDDKAT